VRSDWKPAPQVGASTSGAAAPALTGTTRFAFSTGGPAVVAIQPGGGNEIEEDQHFLLRLNGPAVETTAAANAWCEVEGIGERLALVIVGGEVRAQVLKARAVAKGPADRTLVVRCERPLPNGAVMRLVWGKDRRGEQSEGADDDRAALPLQCGRLQRRLHVRARARRRAVPADPADERALQAPVAEAGGAIRSPELRRAACRCSTRTTSRAR
jgi:hypothetical protein